MPPSDDVNAGTPPDTAVSDAGNSPGRSASDGGASKDFPGDRPGARSSAPPSGDGALVEECEALVLYVARHGDILDDDESVKTAVTDLSQAVAACHAEPGRPRSVVEIARCICRGHTIYRQDARSERPIHPGHRGRNQSAMRRLPDGADPYGPAPDSGQRPGCPALFFVGSTNRYSCPERGVGGIGSPFTTVRSSPVPAPPGPTISYCPEAGAVVPGGSVSRAIGSSLTL